MTITTTATATVTFQYAMTRDPAVIETVRRNLSRHAGFVDAALAWAAERGFENAITFTHNALSQTPGARVVDGLPREPIGFGEWTRPRGRNGSRPKKSNTVELEAMRAIRFMPNPIPGVPGGVTRTDGGTMWWLSPAIVVVGDVAYLSYSDLPDLGSPALGPQWSELAASEFRLSLGSR